MRFLIDTNILIPLEPTSVDDVEAGTSGQAIQLVRLLHKNGHQACVHPATLIDLSRDKALHRRTLRTELIRKYPELPHPPKVSNSLAAVIGEAEEGSNDYCDNLLLAAVDADAVDWLVTEDEKLFRKANRAGLGDRVLSTLAAIQIVVGLSEKPVPPPPAVERTVAHVIPGDDPILIH